MTQALMLAAGMGKRLSELTKDYTKCMVQVGDRTLLHRAIESLKMSDIDRLVLVVGYKKDLVKQYVKDNFPDFNVVFVDNDDYATTNNIYSLFLAKDYLLQDKTILLESDLIYEPNLINDLLHSANKNVAAVAKYAPWMDGTVVKVNTNHTIKSIVEKKDFNPDETDLYYKTVNIYKLDKAFCKDLFLPRLIEYIKKHGTNCYYELVFKDLVDTGYDDFGFMDVGETKWYEIDNMQDYKTAIKLFSN